MQEAQILYRENCTLGEGALWHPIDHALYWVDILKPALHYFQPETEFHQFWRMPDNICCVAPNQSGGLIAGMRSGLAFLRKNKSDVQYRCFLPEKYSEIMMINDGHCDCMGRFWFGTKDIGERNPVAKIFSFENNKIKTHDIGFVVSNGLVFSHDARFFYVADSPNRVIYRYDYDKKHGEISNKTVFATLNHDAGFPDGMCVDSQGGLWNAHFNGWRVTRYLPNGKIDRVIRVPTQSPTSCCLGGKNFNTLFITSAKRDLNNTQFAEQPAAGNVFSITVDVAGVSEPLFTREGDAS